MTCSAQCCAINEMFDGRAATQELERYRKKGPRPSTARLLAALHDANIDGATVLDVGGGIAVIPHELLSAGAARATVVDASSAHLAAAREEADRRTTGDRLELVLGDFVMRSAEVAPADVVTLDKVVCCFPDMDRLLAAATARARRLFGIVYPRDDWWLRSGVSALNAFRKMRGSDFRGYVFPASAIQAAIARDGFTLRTHEHGFVWVVALYERTAARGGERVAR